MKIISIIVPVFNEQNTINQILGKIKNSVLIGNVKKEVIVINDGSTDGTHKHILEFIHKNPQFTINYISENNNRGKGAAIRLGLQKTTGDFVIIQDADLEYDPDEYNLLLQPVLDGFADVVYGSRFMSGNPHRVLFFGNRLGNQIVTFVSNMLTNLNLSDVQTCFKLFKTDIIKKISLKEDGFGFETEITAKIASVPKIRIYEVGISYYGRTYEDGKKFKLRDAFNVFYCLIKYNILSK